MRSKAAAIFPSITVLTRLNSLAGSSFMPPLHPLHRQPHKGVLVEIGQEGPVLLRDLGPAALSSTTSRISW